MLLVPVDSDWCAVSIHPDVGMMFLPFLMAPADTRIEMKILCQKEKNNMPLTHKNLADTCQFTPEADVPYSRTGRNGFRSELTATQNIARQLVIISLPLFCSVSDSSLETETNADVVHHANVGVAGRGGEGALFVRSRRFERDRRDD